NCPPLFFVFSSARPLRLPARGRRPISRQRARRTFGVRTASEPILNVPPVVTALLVAFVIIHAGRAILSPEADFDFLLLFSFIPARYDPVWLAQDVPGGIGARIWTFVTYALIHADVLHLGVNAVWFLAFGSAVARRFGAARFLLFFAVTAAAGAPPALFPPFRGAGGAGGGSPPVLRRPRGGARFALPAA